MRRLLFFAFVVLAGICFTSCSEDDEQKPGTAANFHPSTISYNTDGIISREAPKDSFVYSSNATVDEYYQFRKNGSVRQYTYQEGALGELIVSRVSKEGPEYIIKPKSGDDQIIELTGYERDTGTPGMIKYTTEGNVIIITRWEYPSLENPDYVMEIDGDIMKRTIVTLSNTGNVHKIEVLKWDSFHNTLEKVITLRDLVFDDQKNPLKNLRKEYNFSESGFYFNHELIEFYSLNNVISYSADYHNEVTGEVSGTNEYNFSYQFDKDGRVISSKVSAGLGEYVDCITSVAY